MKPQVAMMLRKKGTFVNNGISDRWFHLRWPSTSRDDEMFQHMKLLEVEPDIRYCLITGHLDDTVKPLSESSCGVPHYHAVVWMADKISRSRVSTMFRLTEWTDEVCTTYYCEAKYQYSKQENFYDYVAKYKHIMEWGDKSSARLTKDKTLTEQSKEQRDERMKRAIEWVKTGQIEK